MQSYINTVYMHLIPLVAVLHNEINGWNVVDYNVVDLQMFYLDGLVLTFLVPWQIKIKSLLRTTRSLSHLKYGLTSKKISKPCHNIASIFTILIVFVDIFDKKTNNLFVRIVCYNFILIICLFDYTYDFLVELC